MSKPIQHPYYLDKKYEVMENYEFPELEDITVTIGESRFEDEAENEKWQKENYVSIYLTRLVSDTPNEVDYLDIADSVSEELLDVVSAIVNPKDIEDYNRRNDLIKTEDVLGLKNITFLDNVIIHGEVEPSTIKAATAIALKWTTKGFDKTEAVCATYQRCSFYEIKNGEKVKLPSKTEKAIFKELGFVELPEEISLIEKSRNSVLAASVAELKLETDYNPSLLDKKSKKIKP